MLQVLADTDASDRHLAAVQLHGALAGEEFEIRTLALGPGRDGSLASLVPVISPSRRSIAAHTQLRAEQRWADVVILHGSDVAAVSALSGGQLSRVLALWDEPQRWADGDRPSRRTRRGAAQCAQVVVPWNAARGSAVDSLALAGDRVAVIHTGTATSAATPSDAARAAARVALGIASDAVVVRFAATTAAAPAARLDEYAQAVESAGGVALRGAELDPELVAAASDIVVDHGGAGGPSVELLQAMRDGAVAVSVPWPAMEDLITDGQTGLMLDTTSAGPRDLRDAVARLVADGPARRTLARAGRAAVEAEYSLSTTTARWLDTVRAALASRP